MRDKRKQEKSREKTFERGRRGGRMHHRYIIADEVQRRAFFCHEELKLLCF